MNSFDFKKYFGNLIGLEPITMKTPKKPMLGKGISDTRLVKRSK